MYFNSSIPRTSIEHRYICNSKNWNLEDAADYLCIREIKMSMDPQVVEKGVFTSTDFKMDDRGLIIINRDLRVWLKDSFCTELRLDQGCQMVSFQT
jgi:hypothetical protein